MLTPINAWFKQALARRWYCLSVWHLLLIPLSWVFGLLSGLRRLAYRLGFLEPFKLSVPVIVVGNINVGGTGKTPLVLWLAKKLMAAGYTPAIISRGYGTKKNNKVSPVYADSNPALVGDEPVLMAKHTSCPVWVGLDRVAVAKKLLQVYPQCNVIISDDGLQHYRLKRDIELVVIDSSRKFGNGYLMPAGPLRELPRRLSKVDAVIFNGGQPAVTSPSTHFAMFLQGAIFQSLVDGQKLATFKDISGKKIHAVAGIGNPERFFQLLERLDLKFEKHVFVDHHAFISADLQFKDAEVILMTEKDAVKCSSFAEDYWWFLPVEAIVEDRLADLILSKLGVLNALRKAKP
jgi:tetraacyldisaccharide 4'-kinase